jgi:hypothetical protein
MKSVSAIWKNGQIVLTQPVDWPDGTALMVEPIDEARAADSESESDLLGDGTSSIARWLAWYDTLEPLEFTPEEEAACQAARRWRHE